MIWTLLLRCTTNIQYAGIETFCPPGTYWPGGIETFCLLRYWNILSPEFINILNYINSICKFFILNCFKYFEIFWQKKNRRANLSKFFVQKYINISILYITNSNFFNPSVKIGYISFFSPSDSQIFHYLLGCHPAGINSLLIFF